MPIITDRIRELVDQFKAGVDALEQAQPNEVKVCLERLVLTVRHLTALNVPGIHVGDTELTLRNAVITGIAEQLTTLLQLYVDGATGRTIRA